MNSLGITDVDNEVLNSADGYLRQHKILELFEVIYFLPTLSHTFHLRILA